MFVKMMRGFFVLFLIFYCNTKLYSANRDSILSYFKQHKLLLVQGKYEKALEVALKALSLAQSQGSDAEKCLAYIQVGAGNYYNKMDKNKVLFEFHNARSIAEAHHIDSLLYRIYHNIGSIYVEESKRDSAVFYLNKSTDLLVRAKKYKELSSTYCVLAEMYMRQKHELPIALNYVLLAEKAIKQVPDSNEGFFVIIKKGIYYTWNQEFKKASQEFLKAKRIADHNQNVQEQLYVYRLLAESKVSELDTNLVSYYDRFINLKDTIFRFETANKLAELESKYGLERKEYELKLKNIELSNQKKQATFNLILFMSGSLLLILIVFILFLRAKEKQKLREVLFQKEQERIRQQTEHDTKEKERNRMAAELHDNVGSAVSFISSKLDWLIEHQELPEQNKDELGVLKEASQEVMNGLRETLWTLNAKDIRNFDVCDKLKVYLKKHAICELKIVDLLKTEYIISNEDVLALFRCTQEVMANINKHSKAKLVVVEFYSDEIIKLKIQLLDDGIGFKLHDKEDHYGIRNIKTRLKEINANLSIDSQPGQGTKISIVYK